MVSLERRKRFVADLRALCEAHRIGIVGTCESESIYGEITLFNLDKSDESDWTDCLREWNKQLNYLEN
jgi:hypothetical protein